MYICGIMRFIQLARASSLPQANFWDASNV